MLTLAIGEAGEWVSAYVFFGVAFAVAVIGVTAIGVWVLRGDARNRRATLFAARPVEEAEDSGAPH